MAPNSDICSGVIMFFASSSVLTPRFDDHPDRRPLGPWARQMHSVTIILATNRSLRFVRLDQGQSNKIKDRIRCTCFLVIINCTLKHEWWRRLVKQSGRLSARIRASRKRRENSNEQFVPFKCIYRNLLDLAQMGMALLMSGLLSSQRDLIEWSSHGPK